MKIRRPEMDDRKPIAEHRAIGGLGQVIIHHPQVGSGQKEGHGIVAVPPLHQRVLDPGVNRVALEESRRDLQRVEDVQHRHGECRRDIKPNRHIHVLLAAFGDCSHQIHGERHPHDGDRDVDGPFEFSVFLAGGEPQRQGDRRGNDDCLPAPEVEPAQKIAEHARLAQALQGIINPHEHAVAHKGEDHGVGVQRTQSPEGRELKVQVQVWPKKLGSDEQAGAESDQAPDHGGDRESPDNPVVVFEGLHLPERSAAAARLFLCL